MNFHDSKRKTPVFNIPIGLWVWSTWSWTVLYPKAFFMTAYKYSNYSPILYHCFCLTANRQLLQWRQVQLMLKICLLNMCTVFNLQFIHLWPQGNYRSISNAGQQQQNQWIQCFLTVNSTLAVLGIWMLGRAFQTVEISQICRLNEFSRFKT